MRLRPVARIPRIGVILLSAVSLALLALAVWSPIPPAVRDEITAAIDQTELAELMPCSWVPEKGDRWRERFVFDEASAIRLTDMEEIRPVFERGVFDGRLMKIRGLGADYAIRLHAKGEATYDIIISFQYRNMIPGENRILDLPTGMERRLRELFRRHGFTSQLN